MTRTMAAGLLLVGLMLAGCASDAADPSTDRLVRLARHHPVSAEHLKQLKHVDGATTTILDPGLGANDPTLRAGTAKVQRYGIRHELVPDEVSLARATVANWGRKVPRTAKNPDGLILEVDDRLIWIVINTQAEWPVTGVPCTIERSCEPMPSTYIADAFTYFDAHSGKELRSGSL